MSEEDLDLHHAELVALFEFWRGRNPDHPALAGAIDPAELRRWIGNLVVMDVIEGDNFVYAYYGESFAQAFGESMVGKSIELLPPEQRALLQQEYERASKERLPVARRYTAEFEGGRATWERLVLPLSTDGKTVDKLLVAAYRLGFEATAP